MPRKGDTNRPLVFCDSFVGGPGYHRLCFQQDDAASLWSFSRVPFSVTSALPYGLSDQVGLGAGQVCCSQFALCLCLALQDPRPYRLLTDDMEKSA